MAFIVTKDYTEYCWDEDQPRGKHDVVEVMGPRNISAAAEKLLKAGKGAAFRMYDDDGLLYYAGRYVEDPEFVPSFWEPEDNELQPLDCYGAPNAGCTELRMMNLKTRKWESI